MIERDAELGGLLQHELELLELDHGHGQMQMASGDSRDGSDSPAAMTARSRSSLDRSARRVAGAVEQLDLFPDAHPHDAHGVMELVARDGDRRE